MKADERDAKRCGKLTVYDNGTDGLSWKVKDAPWMFEGGDFGMVSGDDMLDYTMEENLPMKHMEQLTEEEREFFISEYGRICPHARHRAFYDAFDNLWKDEAPLHRG